MKKPKVLGKYNSFMKVVSCSTLKEAEFHINKNLNEGWFFGIMQRTQSDFFQDIEVMFYSEELLIHNWLKNELEEKGLNFYKKHFKIKKKHKKK